MVIARTTAKAVNLFILIALIRSLGKYRVKGTTFFRNTPYIFALFNKNVAILCLLVLLDVNSDLHQAAYTP